ncbi:hypothetical protein [Sorangium sp. So ce1151]|uniref:hypothetical protein n=1 Tax=Sorangium sp. So ce1151 TaxID=3133332 RepID=UPI003F62449D
MTLGETINRLDTLDENAILCVRQPWTPSSECAVTAPDENLGVPRHVKDSGLAYFLEVHVAREVLDVFGDKPPTTEEKVRLLIHYAENDAYPEWVYQR